MEDLHIQCTGRKIHRTDDIQCDPIPGQDPGWFLSIYEKDKIELFDAIRIVEVVICEKETA